MTLTCLLFEVERKVGNSSEPEERELSISEGILTIWSKKEDARFFKKKKRKNVTGVALYNNSHFKCHISSFLSPASGSNSHMIRMEWSMRQSHFANQQTTM